MACDLWTAAFFTALQSLDDGATDLVPTTAIMRRALTHPNALHGQLVGEAIALSQRQAFFHWPLEFPEVIGAGGFDVVLGNPPWERIKLQEQEFFAARDPDIVTAPNKAARQRLIDTLPGRNPALAVEFAEAKHAAEAQSKIVRGASRFPMTAVGDVNVYALFAELARALITVQGRVGLVLPTGIATDDQMKMFFSDMMTHGRIVRLIGFENEEFIFPGVANVVRFCLLVVSGSGTARADSIFAFYLRRSSQLHEVNRLFSLDNDTIRLVNPNSGTCPIFRTNHDKALTIDIYRRVPVLVDERLGNDRWLIRFCAMFHMAGDSGLFCGAPQPDLLPLYEAKLFWHFDHRFGSYELKGQMAGKGGRGLPDMPLELHDDPSYVITPQYWVSVEETERRVPKFWPYKWLMAFRDIANSKVERTVISAVLPRVGVGHTAPLVLPREAAPGLIGCLLGCFNSLVLDYVARQKVGGTHLTYSYLYQFPVLPPSAYTTADLDFIVPRVVELTFTAWDVQAFARDCGYDGPPYRWDDDRRAVLRAELDAYYAALYGLTRDEVRYILDPADVYGPEFPGETFRVLKQNELKRYGEYRTRRLVLEAWDRLGLAPRNREGRYDAMVPVPTTRPAASIPS